MKELERLLKQTYKPDEKRELRNRIEKRFKKKHTGFITLNLKNGMRLRIEYMYGNKYSIRKRQDKIVTDLSIMTSLDNLIEIIFKERNRKTKFGIVDKINSRTKGRRK